MLAFIVKLDVP